MTKMQRGFPGDKASQVRSVEVSAIAGGAIVAGQPVMLTGADVVEVSDGTSFYGIAMGNNYSNSFAEGEPVKVMVSGEVFVKVEGSADDNGVVSFDNTTAEWGSDVEDGNSVVGNSLYISGKDENGIAIVSLGLISSLTVNVTGSTGGL